MVLIEGRSTVLTAMEEGVIVALGVPYEIHGILTDKGVQFVDRGRGVS